MAIKSGLFVLVIFITTLVYSQDYSSLIQQRIEYWMEKNQSENIDLTVQVERWSYYEKNPLNINKVTLEELVSLDLLSQIQMQELLNHRKVNGNFLSLLELQTLPHWSEETIALVLPFITVEDRLESLPITFTNVLKYGTLENLSRYQQLIDLPKAYKTSPTVYLGSSLHVYERLRYTYSNQLSIGITGDKDAGEPFGKNGNKTGFDFYSTHLFYAGKRLIRKAVLGDYHLQFGQGLACWTTYGFGKTSDISTIQKIGSGIKPHTSADESRFFRGGAMEFGYKNWALTVFVSDRKKDGRTLTDSSNAYLLSMSTSGYHRTLNEMALKNQWQEKVIGTNIAYTRNRFSMGGRVLANHIQPSIQASSDYYQKYDFSGSQLLTYSVDYSYSYRNFMLFGEIAQTNFQYKSALIQGVTLALDANTSLSIVYRNYDKAYQTFYTSGFSEGNNVQNERGIYIGVKVQPSPRLILQAYMDFFQFPWLKYQVNQASKGDENFVQLTYKPTKKSEVYIRYRLLNKEQNSDDEIIGIPYVVNRTQQNIRFQASIPVTESFTFRTKIEQIHVSVHGNKTGKGILMQQDIFYKSLESPFDFTLRYALFDIDTWDARIYSYESNPTYVFSNPAYYMKGSRSYLMVRYTRNKCSLWFRYGLYYYPQNKSIGSGNDLIKGNLKREVMLQFQLRI